MIDEMTGVIDVVVVGVGLAGLSAATELVAAGAAVVVLEARDRVGGRVFSHRFADGQWCERGAEFIDSTHTEVLALAESLGLRLTGVPSQRDDVARLIDVGGRANPLSWYPSVIAECATWHAALVGTGRVGQSRRPDLGARRIRARSSNGGRSARRDGAVGNGPAGDRPRPAY